MAKLIYVLCTGGTIEKQYSEQTGTVVNLDSKIDRYLRQLRLPEVTVETVRLMNKDSLEMTQEDRERILSAIRQRLASLAPIIVTHGTDTMVETGMFLKSHLLDLAVPVILTGAMSPLGFELSDGLQNLTESLFAARILTPGIYVVIHNQVFPVDQTKKDRERATFVKSSQ